jgi:hypothetical protein
MITEKQAAAGLRKTLKSCQTKILKAMHKYDDYPYLESICEQANLKLEEFIEDARAE